MIDLSLVEPMLTVFAVYDRPRDYPNRVVVRAWLCADQPIPCEPAELFASLDAAREFLARRGLQNIGRMPDDDSKIVECWV